LGAKRLKEKVICIYHKNCTDGTTAAAVLLTKFPNCKLIPLDHNYSDEDIQNLLNEIDENTVVYIVDFSLREGDTEKILQKAKKVINIDHHIGVKERLEELAKRYSNFEFVFDNHRSGASLTWIYFYGKENIPEIIKLVEDKDIWTWNYGDKTKYANSYLIILTDKPEKIKEYILTNNIEKVIENGKIISEFTDYLINNFIEKVKEIYIKIGEYKVKAFNTGLFQSEIGNILSNEFKQAVVLFSISGYNVKFSFRSTEGNNPTALELAQILGGSGHKHAAGASVNLKEFCEMILFENNGG
jgi:oligoribonuclease NrnB/cAMP/cGMP phosphodiesterase (DHH superfamily)